MNKYKNFSKKSRKKYLERKGCKNKKRYDILEEALKKNCNVYKCGFCGGYHRSEKFYRFIKKLKRLDVKNEI